MKYNTLLSQTISMPLDVLRSNVLGCRQARRQHFEDLRTAARTKGITDTAKAKKKKVREIAAKPDLSGIEELTTKLSF